MKMTFNNWRVFYWDNDGRKQIIKQGLYYHQAVKLWQKLNDQIIFGLGYEAY